MEVDHKYKIIIVHSLFSPYGGGEVIAYNTFKGLQEKGYKVYFFATDKKPYFEEQYEGSKYFVPSRKQYKFLGKIKNFLPFYYNLSYAQRFAKMLDDIKPDIVHIHGLNDLTYSVLKPCFKRNIPVVKTEHTALLACPVHSFVIENKRLCKNKLCKKGNYFHCIFNRCAGNIFLSSINAFANEIQDLTGYNHKISKFITPSYVLKKVLEETGIPENKITVVENFSEFENVKGEVNNYFLFSGRLCNYKGVKTLFNAISNLPNNILFHIAGTGELEEELKEFCEKKKLDNVKFLGFLTKEKMIEEYKNSVAVIMPSECFESFGMTNIEAAMFDKPSISSNIGGLSEVVEDNKTGLVFEPYNVDQLKDCILKYWNDKDLAIKHGKNAKEKALKKYSKDVYFEKLLKVYGEVINA